MASKMETADRLHSAAIHLLRRVRVQDSSFGLTPSRLSALSVIVFGGPLTASELAKAEQVSRPTISRLLKDLLADRLVRQTDDPYDKRVRLIEATRKGRKLLDRGRQRRVKMLASDLARLTQDERAILAKAAEILARLNVPRSGDSLD